MSLQDLVIIEEKENIDKKNEKKICQQLYQAIKVINAEYQRIDWEDQAFLNRVLTNTLEIIEAGEEI